MCSHFHYNIIHPVLLPLPPFILRLSPCYIKEFEKLLALSQPRMSTLPLRKGTSLAGHVKGLPAIRVQYMAQCGRSSICIDNVPQCLMVLGDFLWPLFPGLP